MRVMMVVVMRMPAAHRNHAACIGNRAAHVLELHRRMMHMKPVAQQMIHLVQNTVAL